MRFVMPLFLVIALAVGATVRPRPKRSNQYRLARSI